MNGDHPKPSKLFINPLYFVYSQRISRIGFQEQREELWKNQIVNHVTRSKWQTMLNTDLHSESNIKKIDSKSQVKNQKPSSKKFGRDYETQHTTKDIIGLAIKMNRIIIIRSEHLLSLTPPSTYAKEYCRYTIRSPTITSDFGGRIG